MSYKVHKWIAVTAGVFLLIWLTSGVVMVLPKPSITLIQEPLPASLELEEIGRSLVEITAGLKKSPGSGVRVKSLTLLKIGATLVYRLDLVDGASELIDSKTGLVFKITPEAAEQIIRYNFRIQSAILRNELVDQHDGGYPWGPLPVYRMIFDDDPSVLFHVSVRGGTIRRSDRWSRIFDAIDGLHTFQPLNFVVKEPAIRRALLALTGLISIAATLTGYYLALSRRRS